MPPDYPEVDGWPEQYNINNPRPDYADLLQHLQDLPAGPVRVVAAGLTKSAAANLRTWLNDKDDVTARTTGRRDQLERYSQQLAEQGIDFTKLTAPNNHIVLAQYTESENA